MPLVHYKIPESSVNNPHDAVSRLVDILQQTRFDVCLVVRSSDSTVPLVEFGIAPDPTDNVHRIEALDTRIVQQLDEPRLKLNQQIVRSWDKKNPTAALRAEQFREQVETNQPELLEHSKRDMFLCDWLTEIVRHWVPKEYDPYEFRGLVDRPDMIASTASQALTTREIRLIEDHFGEWDVLSFTNSGGVHTHYTSLRNHFFRDANTYADFIWGPAKLDACGLLSYEPERIGSWRPGKGDRKTRILIDLWVASLSSQLLETLRNTRSLYRFGL